MRGEATQFVYTAAAIRALDDELKRLDLLELSMELAGKGVADLLLSAHPGERVLALAGGGANGGDALVAARHLAAAGLEVQVLALPAKHPLTRANRKRLAGVGMAPTPLTPASLGRALNAADVVLDGLTGTGFQPPLRAPLPGVVAAVNASGLPVVAIDVPSGLNADAPELPDGGEGVVRAALTCALVGAKPALLFGPAAGLAGRVQVVPLGLPETLLARHAVARRFGPQDAGALLPVRGQGAHKGTAGRVWVLGGHPGTVGAPLLSGWAALRAGSGLVTLYSQAELPLLHPELMQHRLDDFASLEDGPRPNAVAVGMGLGPQAAGVARQVLGWRVPTVIDADALQPELAGAGHAQVVWTPHPGEAGRLLDRRTSEVSADPLGAAAELQARYGGVVVLKGGPTVVAAPDGVSVNVGGNPGMGTAGMGDALSGVIASLLGQGLAAPEAARVGVCLHARAGDLAERLHGYGLTAADMIEQLGPAWLSLVQKT